MSLKSNTKCCRKVQGLESRRAELDWKLGTEKKAGFSPERKRQMCLARSNDPHTSRRQVLGRTLGPTIQSGTHSSVNTLCLENGGSAKNLGDTQRREGRGGQEKAAR